MTRLEKERDQYPGLVDKGIVSLHCPRDAKVSDACADKSCKDCWNEQCTDNP
jgi:hypothetical protein